MDWFFCGARPSPARSNIQITPRIYLFAAGWPDLVAAPEDGRASGARVVPTRSGQGTVRPTGAKRLAVRQINDHLCFNLKIPA
jgi:hypothetical protein